MGNAALKIDEKTRVPVSMQDVSALDKLVRFVNERKDKPFIPGDFNRFERELAERLREAGREALRRTIDRPSRPSCGP